MNRREEFQRYMRAASGKFEGDPGRHLSEKELIAYQQGQLEADEREKAQAHLVQCGVCIEVFKDISDFFEPAREGKETVSEAEIRREWQDLWQRVQIEYTSASPVPHSGLVGLLLLPRMAFAFVACLALALLLTGAWVLWLRQEKQQLTGQWQTEQRESAERYRQLERENNSLREQTNATRQDQEAERLRQLERENRNLREQVSSIKRERPTITNRPPSVALEPGVTTPGQTDVVRDATTVCTGDKVVLRAIASDPDGDTLLYSWQISSGRIVGEGASTAFDTTGLAPGDYPTTVKVDDGHGRVASDTKTIRVVSCPPMTVCFDPNLNLDLDRWRVDAGERINFKTSGVTAGRNYGNVRYDWTASHSTITSNGLIATLDTTGVTGGTSIEVTVRAASDVGNCTAIGVARVIITPPALPPPSPIARDLGQCTTFKRNSARVDNACMDVLRNVIIPALQADPGAQIDVDSFRAEAEEKDLDLQRGKNIRDRLTDGSIGIAIDLNRIVVRARGISTAGEQVKFHLVPTGAIR
ncbi:MAG: hypothetical protein MOB07_07945 [Acidobacteria bacterium]|nr:hypothetical protein [Acidobacteriota bacterium]